MKPGGSGREITGTYCPPLKDDLGCILLENRGSVKEKINTKEIKDGQGFGSGWQVRQFHEPNIVRADPGGMCLIRRGCEILQAIPSHPLNIFW